jgi:hypothetical protein
MEDDEEMKNSGTNHDGKNKPDAVFQLQNLMTLRSLV